MSRVDDARALGTVYTKTTTGMTASYTFGTTQGSGAPTRLTLFGSIVLSAATSITGYKVQVSVLDSSGVKYPVATTQNDSAVTTAVEQTIATTTNATTNFLLQTASIGPSVAGWVVSAKAVTAAGTTGDSITITADVQ